MAKIYKIVAIIQVYNEFSKGNVQRFFEHHQGLFNEIVVYDDGSTDGTFEYCQKYTPNVIRSAKNDFSNEVQHKSILLEFSQKFNPDFVFWIDADEVISAPQKENLFRACEYCEINQFDALRFRQINLWRSNVYERIDTEYAGAWPVRLWKNSPLLKFENIQRGLHQSSVPSGIDRIERFELLGLLHYGFSEIDQIAEKYLKYRELGQRGYHLRRLIQERGIQFREVPNDRFPEKLRFSESLPLPLSFEQFYNYTDKKCKNSQPPITIFISETQEKLEIEKSYKNLVETLNRIDFKIVFLIKPDQTEILKFLNDNHLLSITTNDSFSTLADSKSDIVVLLPVRTEIFKGWFELMLSAFDGVTPVELNSTNGTSLLLRPKYVKDYVGMKKTIKLVPPLKKTIPANSSRRIGFRRVSVYSSKKNHVDTLDIIKGLGSKIYCESSQSKLHPFSKFIHKFFSKKNGLGYKSELIIMPFADGWLMDEPVPGVRYMLIVNKINLPIVQEKNVFDLVLKDRTDCSIYVPDAKSLEVFLFCEPRILDTNFSEVDQRHRFLDTIAKELDATYQVEFSKFYNENTNFIMKPVYTSAEVFFDFYMALEVTFANLVSDSVVATIQIFKKDFWMRLYCALKRLIPNVVKRNIVKMGRSILK